jgi:uncharacterized membrane protein
MIISIVIFILCSAWVILTDKKEAFPIKKIYLVIGMITALLVEIYSFLVIDSLSQKMQEPILPTIVLKLPQ